MELGPGFSIEANRERFLKCTGLSLLGLAASVTFCYAFAGSPDWSEKMKILPGIVLTAIAAVTFGLGAWVRWLDWTRGRRGLLGSAE